MKIRQIMIVVSLLLLMALVNFSFRLSRVSKTSLEYSRTRHAMTIVSHAVAEYVETFRTWPTSWEELANNTTYRNYGGYEWPKDLAAVQEYIILDFSYQAQKLHEESKDDFNAIRPRNSFPKEEFDLIPFSILNPER